MVARRPRNIQQKRESLDPKREAILLRRLLECTRLFNSTLDLKQLTTRVLEVVRSAVGFTRGTVFVVDRKKRVLRSFIAQGVADFEITVPVGKGIAGRVASTRKVLDVPSNASQGRFSKQFDNVLMFRTQDIYCLPLLNKQSACIGVLQLLNRTRTLSTEDRQFLESMAIELASALEHAWSHYCLQKKHEHESRRAAALTKANHKLRGLAFQDPLTGLKNHRYLQDALDRELARSKRHHKPCALIVCDVDHFKLINDTYGHQTGNVVLTRIARALRRSTRKYDILARHGGEEFAIVLPETTGPQAMRKAERCRKEIARLRIRVSGAVIQTTVSIGVSVFNPLRPVPKATYIELADLALYKSKKKGRNRVTMAGDW